MGKRIRYSLCRITVYAFATAAIKRIVPISSDQAFLIGVVMIVAVCINDGINQLQERNG